MGNKIEIEKRYLINDRPSFEKSILDLGAIIAYHAHVIDHWYIPKSIKSREQHDEWFDNGKGCGIRVREQDNGPTGNLVTSLEAKRLTSSLNHNTFLEAEVIIDSFDNAKRILELMDLKEFLTIDKNRVMYKYDKFKICIDDIKGFGVGIEIEIDSFTTRELALDEISEVASKLNLEEDQLLEKSMTVLAMDKLANFK